MVKITKNRYYRFNYVIDGKHYSFSDSGNGGVVFRCKEDGYEKYFRSFYLFDILGKVKYWDKRWRDRLEDMTKLWVDENSKTPMYAMVIPEFKCSCCGNKVYNYWGTRTDIIIARAGDTFSSTKVLMCDKCRKKYKIGMEALYKIIGVDIDNILGGSAYD